MWNRPEDPEHVSGDDGMTYLETGERVPKTHSRIVVAGDLEELNCHIGLISYATTDRSLIDVLGRIQFVLGKMRSEFLGDEKSHVTREDLGHLDKNLEETREYHGPSYGSLPNGSKDSIQITLAGTVCRRAERHAWRAYNIAENKAGLNDGLMVYLNRLSDFLLVISY